MLTKGRILEIGHFLGRSTACIAEALSEQKSYREFISYDLGFISSGEFKRFYDKVHKNDIKVPELFQYVYQQNVRSTDLALMNLHSLNLSSFVKLISGNFIEIDKSNYDLVFCDAMHEYNEIQINLPEIISRLNDNAICAFHDMNDENIEIIISLSSLKLIDRADSLGVFVHNK